jgi:hypothetical protein
MDFRLFLAVLKRYKRMVISGMVLAVVLSVLSYGTPGLKGGKPTIVPRGSEVWEGEAELLISQEGFPYGRAVTQVTPGKASTPSQPIGDFNYMASLSSVYAAVANGNSIQHQAATEAGVLLCPSTRPCASVQAAEVDNISDGVPEPLITVTSSAPTAVDAVKLATSTLSVLRNDITQQQAAAGTPVDQRVQLQTVKTGSPAILAQGPSKSIPILVLFAIVSASIALAFIRNNHSEDPVRSTRRRLDEGLVLDDGRALAGDGNGRIVEPEHGRVVHAGSGSMQLLGLRRAGSAPRLAEEENGAPQRADADEPSATHRRRAWTGRQPHLLRGAGFERETRD